MQILRARALVVVGEDLSVRLLERARHDMEARYHPGWELFTLAPVKVFDHPFACSN